MLALPVAVAPGILAPYDGPKAWWLQAIVVLTALDWARRQAQAHLPTAPMADRSTLVLRGLVAAYAGWWVLTTIVSVAPGQSLLGSLARGFGLLTILSAVALFPLVQICCGTAGLRRSLIDATLLGSVAVCFLALLQAFGWEGLPGTLDPAAESLRIRSSLGQHVFLGSYLVVLIPLTAARFVWATGVAERVSRAAMSMGAIWIAGVALLAWLASAHPLSWPLMAVWAIVAAFAWNRLPGDERAPGFPSRPLLGVLLITQVVVLTLSGARGPFLGAAVALAVVGVLLWRRRRTAASPSTIGALVGLVCFGLLLGVLAGPLVTRTIPAPRRLAMQDREALDTAQTRLRAWSGIVTTLGRQASGQTVMPGQRPLMRSGLGYGLDTQEFILDAFTAERDGRPARLPRGELRYVLDRAHDVLLDHLVTGGLVGAAIWIVLVAGIVVVGASRLREGADEDWTVRLGCLGAVLGHLVEGGVGIETAVGAALFWTTAAMLTAPSISAGVESSSHPRPARAMWIILLIGLAAGGALAITATTVSLLASMAFTRGIFAVSAGQTDEAQLDLQYAIRLAPWLTGPRSVAADLALRTAGLDRDPERRAVMFRGVDAFLAEARGGAPVSGDIWLSKARVALARALDGESAQRAPALVAFAMADHLRPNDADVLTPWSVALLLDAQPGRARQLAERVLATDPRDWLAWTVVARASSRLGDAEKARQAAVELERLTPPASAPFVDRLP